MDEKKVTEEVKDAAEELKNKDPRDLDDAELDGVAGGGEGNKSDSIFHTRTAPKH